MIMVPASLFHDAEKSNMKEVHHSWDALRCLHDCKIRTRPSANDDVTIDKDYDISRMHHFALTILCIEHAGWR